MATFQVTDPQSGKVLRLTGDSPPTEQELNQIFSQFEGGQDDPSNISPAIPSPDAVPDQRSGLEQAVGVGETALSLAGEAVAAPISGLAGIAAGAIGGGSEGAAEAVESTREFITGFTNPRTEAGKETLSSVQETLAPLGEALSGAETFLGDQVFDITGSPALAALAKSLPTAAMEILGFKGGGRLAARTKKGPSKRVIKQNIIDSAPDVETLKGAARGVYNELDESGARVKPQAYNSLVNKIEMATKKQGMDARVTPKAAGAIEVLKDIMDTSPTLTEMDTLRKVAGNVAKSIDPTEASLGKQIIGELDNFLDTLSPTSLFGKGIDAKSVAPKYRAARELWGRARRSELITEAIDKGSRAASGLENGVRQEFNRIINSKKLSKFFPKDEIASMKAVVDGNFTKNMLKHVGKFGMSVDRSGTNLMAALGGVGGGVTGGFGGAGAVLAAGTGAKMIGKLAAKKEAKFVDSMTRAGTNAGKIVEAYLTAFPKSKRKSTDLAKLLSDPQIDVSGLLKSSNILRREAAEIAQGRRRVGQLLGSAAVSGSQKQPQQQVPPQGAAVPPQQMLQQQPGAVAR